MAAVAERTGADHAARYLGAFDARQARAGTAGPAWLTAARTAAIAHFAAQGFPTTRDEDWRFTPIAPIVQTPFVEGEVLHVSADEIAALSLGEGVAAELVFVNGYFVPALSRLPATLPAGLEVGSLAAVLAARPGVLEPWLDDLARAQGSPFAALNTGFFADGAVVQVARKAQIDAPVHVIFYSTVSGAPSISHPRLLVVAGERSEAQVIETYAGPEGQVYFANAVSEFIVGPGAVLEHTRVQRESLAAYHVGTQVARTARDTTFRSRSFVLGGAIARNDIAAVLGGEGGDTTLDGLYLAGGTQIVDTHTAIDHALPHNGSHELYKGILGGKARGVFNGKIIVRQDAQKTDAKQTNKALLLSDNAQIDSKPQLEIFADDVKCTHGATIGQLDPDMLFYLRSRGIGRDEARALLIGGFAGDIVGRVRWAPLRERLDAEVLRRIPR